MSSPTAAKAGPPIKVLVVDDEAAHAEAVADSLARVGYDCTVATSGAEGMAMLARDAFEVIVTDLRMKDSTGLELLAKSKELLPDAEVILVTGHGIDPELSAAVRGAAREFFALPDEPMLLQCGGIPLAFAQAGQRRRHVAISIASSVSPTSALPR